MTHPFWLPVLVAFAAIVTLSLWRKLAPRSYRLPPGPHGSFILDVARQIPKAEPWKRYLSWSRSYRSSIISFRVYNRTTIVLNSSEDVESLLERRQDIYSERPMSWMYHVICDRGRSVFNVNGSDPRHKRYRKLILSELGPNGTKKYANVIQSESRNLARALIANPDDLVSHAQRNAVSVVLRMSFGYTVGPNDPFVQVSKEASKISGWATEPGRWLVDYFPIVRFVPHWFPGAEWKRRGLEWRERLRHLSDVPHLWTKEQMVSTQESNQFKLRTHALGTHIRGFDKAVGSYEESFTSRLLRRDDGTVPSIEEEDVVKWCAGGLYAGAGDTTVSAIVSFVLLMALHPTVQKKARAEVLAVSAVGERADAPEEHPGDLPSIAQLHRLPYLNAVMKEVLRFAPVGNLALPHRVSQDDEYMGYHIPKDATVIANVWAIMHDETLYPEPFEFRPERFAPGSTTRQPDPRRWAFGFGKRTCPGIYFAETTVLYAMYCILGSCSISVANDPESVAKEIEFTTGLTSHIKPFPIAVCALESGGAAASVL